MSASLSLYGSRVGSGECWEQQLCPVGRPVGGTCEAVRVEGGDAVQEGGQGLSLPSAILQTWAWAWM